MLDADTDNHRDRSQKNSSMSICSSASCQSSARGDPYVRPIGSSTIDNSSRGSPGAGQGGGPVTINPRHFGIRLVANRNRSSRAASQRDRSSFFPTSERKRKSSVASLPSHGVGRRPPKRGRSIAIYIFQEKLCNRGI